MGNGDGVLMPSAPQSPMGPRSEPEKDGWDTQSEGDGDPPGTPTRKCNMLSHYPIFSLNDLPRLWAGEEDDAQELVYTGPRGGWIPRPPPGEEEAALLSRLQDFPEGYWYYRRSSSTTEGDVGEAVDTCANPQGWIPDDGSEGGTAHAMLWSPRVSRCKLPQVSPVMFPGVWWECPVNRGRGLPPPRDVPECPRF